MGNYRGWQRQVEETKSKQEGEAGIEEGRQKCRRINGCQAEENEETSGRGNKWLPECLQVNLNKDQFGNVYMEKRKTLFQNLVSCLHKQHFKAL